VTSSSRFALSVTLASILMASRASAAAPAPSLDGGWTGSVTGGARHPALTAAARLGQTNGRITGIITLAGSGDPQTFAVTGVARARLARLRGVLGVQRMVWKGHWDPKGRAWRGLLRMLEGRRRTMRARLVLARGGESPVQCGADFFAQQLMPTVFEPICAQCHVAGGAAQSTRLRVVAGDPPATAQSAITLVDMTNPAQSRLLLKPRGELAHGGGQRIVAGSAEEQALEQWIALVTAPDCAPTNPGGTGDLYTDNCASCHGQDARGVSGRPDIHCSRSIHDIVRSGRKGALDEMPAFPNLSDADIATIQAVLVGLCPAESATGAALYAGNCASCHGTDATGAPDAPSVRCATLVADAVTVGRGAAMASFSVLSGVEVSRIEAYLDGLCTQAGRTGADLYASNCATCHGGTAGGGRNALGQHGPGIRCTGTNDYQEKVREGEDGMPSFPALSPGDVTAIASFVHGAYCSVP
jgi:mono/diheme cytochrome c family protein